MNRHDSARLVERLVAAGFEPVDVEAEADLIVVNTCAVREKAAHKARSLVGRLLAERAGRPGRRVIVAGCVAQQLGERFLEMFPDLAGVVGPDRLDDLIRLAASPDARGPRVAVGFDDGGPERFPAARPDVRAPGPTAFVTVSKGCSQRCTFCIVPSVRGPLRTRPPEDVVAETARLVEHGVREVTLIGQAVNDYVHGDAGFADLLARVGSVRGLERLRYTSPHPRFVDERTARAHAEVPALCGHVHLPVQSGSDAVLHRMARRYDRRGYLDVVASLRRARPGITFGTDVIVGFPGETEGQFAETLFLLEEVGFVQVFSFAYSPRPGTAAARWADDVSAEAKSERLARLQAAADRIAARHRAAQVGREVDVLLEGPSDRGGGTAQGRTVHQDVVHVRARSGDVPGPPGASVRAVVVEALPHCLAAEIAAVEGAP